jgi:hypothetical protein
MTDDGWRKVRAIPSTKPDGTPVNIIVGMVRREGHLEPALRIDDGPIALLPLEEVGADVIAAIRKTLLDWYEQEGR